MESGDSSQGRKRKPSARNIEIGFTVSKNQCFKLMKPTDGSSVDVCIKSEHISDFHAMRLMYTLNHHNILSMKSIGPKATPDTFLVFIEKCSADLTAVIWRKSHFNNHIPSISFQTFVRGIVEGVEFLRINGVYHGNLSWATTLYVDDTAKLGNFKTKDGISTVDAQLQDWDCIRIMLQGISDYAAQYNQQIPRTGMIFYDELDALIQMIASSNCDKLPTMKDDALKEVFFWTKDERTTFIITEVSEWIHKDGFKDTFKEVINKSSIVEVPWDSDLNNRLTYNDVNSCFIKILQHCNSFRTVKFNCLTKSDCVELACAAYTHENEIQGIRRYVDWVFQTKYPKMFVELKRIVKVMVELAT